MERIVSEAFITVPTLKGQPRSQLQKQIHVVTSLRKNCFNLRQKIICILKSLTDKQLVTQAINNIGIPKNFIDINYVNSRPEQEINKIHSAVCSLKKQVTRIKRYSSDTPQMLNNIFATRSKKNLDEKCKQAEAVLKKDKNFAYLNKQIGPQQKIKQAIEQQLEYRETLQNRMEKQSQCDKIKQEIMQKRKQKAKNFNKKAIQIFERQKQKQQKWFQQIQVTNNAAQNSESKHEKKSISRNLRTSNCTKRQEKNDFIKGRKQNQIIKFQQYIEEDYRRRKDKDQNYIEFKHRRMNSLNQRIIYKQLKSQEIRQRKINNYQQEESEKLKKWIEKEHKIQHHRSPYSQTKQSRNSQSMQATSANLMTTTNLMRNSTGFYQGTNPYTVQDEKENLILQKINKKNQRRQMLLNTKIQKIKDIRQRQEIRREIHKQSQLKLLTQHSQNIESFVNQKSFINKQAYQLVPNSHQQNIKIKHNNVLTNISCDQAIMRLRKLPKMALQKKLKDLKNKALKQMLAKNIVQFFK